jgi:hypothetical protein
VNINNNIIEITSITRTKFLLKKQNIDSSRLTVDEIDEITCTISEIRNKHNSFNNTHLKPIINMLNIGFKPDEIPIFLPYP